jgi:hypothetical protein
MCSSIDVHLQVFLHPNKEYHQRRLERSMVFHVPVCEHKKSIANNLDLLFFLLASLLI